MRKSFVVKFAIAALLALGSFAHAQDEITPIPEVDAPDATQVVNQASVSDNVSVEGQVDEVAPVAPVEDSVLASPAIAPGSDCVGCGQARPIFAGRMMGSRMMAAPVSNGCSSCATGCQPISSGCSGCAAGCQTISTGCSSCAQVSMPCSNCSSCGTTAGCSIGCGTVQTATPIQPMTSCACGQIGQVSYDQPIYQSQTPTTLASTPISIMTSPVVNPAPAPSTYTPSPVYNQVTTGTSSCCGGSTVSAPAQVGTSYFSTACNTCTPTRGRLRGRLFRNR